MKFNINDTVKVIDIVDAEGNPDYLGKIGIVTDINTNGATGNTIEDPLYVISFGPNELDSFWKEELELVTL